SRLEFRLVLFRSLTPVPLDPGQAIDVREHHFLVATGAIGYDWFKTNVWFTTSQGDEQETHYPLGMYMDRFYAAEQPGLLLLHICGWPCENLAGWPCSRRIRRPTILVRVYGVHRPVPHRSGDGYRPRSCKRARSRQRR